MQRVCVVGVLVTLLALLTTGCGSMKSVLADPEWSENYALEADCDVPNLIDGSMYTTGQTILPEHTRGTKAEDSRFTNVTVTLKKPKDIKRVVIRRRSEDSAVLDVDVMAMVDGEWKEVRKIRGEIGNDNASGNDVDIRIKAVTDKVMVKIQRATRTADGKSAIAAAPGSGGGRDRGAQIERLLQQPIKLAEIELYGVKAEQES